MPPEHGPRFLRFDFHPTEEGWRLSEANTDVPGGSARVPAASPQPKLAISDSSSA